MVSLDASLSKIENRESTRSVVRYARVSAHKARPVLNQIRNKSVGRADEILAFSERSVSDVISGCLQSAVANARNNDGIPQEELFVSECFADEGPTLKRFRPRARGRATSIFKRTCHLTVIVSRYSEDELEAFQTRAELRDERKNLESEMDSTEEPESKNKKARSSKEDVVEEDVVEEDVVEEDVVEEDVVEEESVEEDLDSDEENDEQNEKEAN
ncbi:MAG: 50S ribosomal protein L22 [Acidimicrobiales bacterium]|nr:50S ribosomal protein L22 [Acidimicrobiales bacterium]